MARGTARASVCAIAGPVPPPPGCRWELDEAPRRADRKRLEAAVDAFNARSVPYAARRFALYLRDGRGRIRAGLDGVVCWDWLFVETLWVEDGLRRGGLGSALLAEAEGEARRRGCHSAWLDTFRAADFYRRRGYAVFGELPAYPAGQTRYFLKKRLTG